MLKLYSPVISSRSSERVQSQKLEAEPLSEERRAPTTSDQILFLLESVSTLKCSVDGRTCASAAKPRLL